jgi:hypothetical protein
MQVGEEALLPVRCAAELGLALSKLDRNICDGNACL